MEIKIENAKAALKTAANRPITERVKTFEDACRELGEDHPFVLAYQNTNLRDPEVAEENRDILAYMKLRIIAAALNDGWEPQFTEDEWRWYPWFTLWTEEELSEKSDGWKADRHLISTGDYSGDWAGFACAFSYDAPSNAGRASVLAFALRAKLSPRIAASNSSAFGLTST